MFLSAAIDSGIGLTAGKILCGKTVDESDSTYLMYVKLKQRFIQLKKFLTINQQPKIKSDEIKKMKEAVSKLQNDLIVQQTISKTLSKENLKLKSDLEKLSMLPKRISDLERGIIRTGLQNSFKEMLTESLQAINAEEWKAILQTIIEKKET
jgi:hypothetical protein